MQAYQVLVHHGYSYCRIITAQKCTCTNRNTYIPCRPGDPYRPVSPLSPLLPVTPSRPSRPGTPSRPSRPSLPRGPWTVYILGVLIKLPLVALSCVDCTLLSSLSRAPPRWGEGRKSTIKKQWQKKSGLAANDLLWWHLKTFHYQLVILKYLIYTGVTVTIRAYQQLYWGTRQQETPQLTWGPFLPTFKWLLSCSWFVFFIHYHGVI